MRYFPMLAWTFFSFSLMASNFFENSIPAKLQSMAYMFPEGAELDYENISYVKKGTTFVRPEEFSFADMQDIECQLEQGKFIFRMDDRNIKLLEAPRTVEVRFNCDRDISLKGGSSMSGIDTSNACVHLDSGEHLMYLREIK